MKRSEAVNIVAEYLNNFRHGETWADTIRDAAELMYILETTGMTPPAVKEPCTTEVLYNGRYVKTEDSFIFTHKWDEE